MTAPAASIAASSPPRRSRMIVWSTIGLGVILLAQLILLAYMGGPMPRLTAGATALGLANNVVFLFGALRRWPRLEKAYPWLSITVMLLIVVGFIRFFLGAR